MTITNITETQTVVEDAEYYRKKIGIQKKKSRKTKKNI